MGILCVAILLSEVSPIPMSLDEPETEFLEGGPVLSLSRTLNLWEGERAPLTDHAYLSTSLSWTWFDHSLGLRDAVGTSFVFGYTASFRSDKERAAQKVDETRISRGYFYWGPLGGLTYAWSELEAAGRRARVMTYFGGYSVNYVWPNGLDLGGSLKLGRIYLESLNSGLSGRNGTLIALSAPEVRLMLGWGFEVGATTTWEFAKTGFNSASHRWIFDFTPALTLTWGF